jgi:hypothetical protein
MKVLLINDASHKLNWGDRAASVSLMDMIRRSGGTIMKTITEDDLYDCSFLAGTSRTDAKERVRGFIPPIVLEARRRFLERRYRVAARPSPLPQTWEDLGRLASKVVASHALRPDVTEAMNAVDVAVVHGDGAMVGNGVVGRAELFLSYVVKKHFGKPVIIVNHTADFSDSRLHRIAREVYPLLDDVVFRDPFSVEKCIDFIEGRFCADTAFLFRPAPREQWVPIANRSTYFDTWPESSSFDPDRPYVCIGGSSIFSVEPDQDLLQRNIVSLIEHLRSSYGGQLVLTASDVPDREAFKPIADRLGLPLIGVSTSIQQAVDILGNADAYIGGRWHPSIFALCGGTPVVFLSGKTFKMEALASLAGLAGRAFDVGRLADEKEAIAEQLGRYLEQGPGLRARLSAWAQNMSENSWGNVLYLRRHWPGQSS